MQKNWRFSILSVITLLILLLSFGCKTIHPNLDLQPAKGTDETGAMKYQLWTGFIHVAPVKTEATKTNPHGVFVLKGSVARNPVDKIILMQPKDTFATSTTMTYAPIKNTMLPEKITVAVEDKMEKRIEQGTALVTGLIGFLSVDNKDTQELITDFKPWSLNLKPILGYGENSITKDEYTIINGENVSGEDTGIGTPPAGWSYTLTIGPSSTTSVNLLEKESKGQYEKFLQDIGSEGILIYPGARTATLRLTHGDPSYVWVQTFQIPDPIRVETAKLPLKGSMTFQECSVSVSPDDQDQRDYFALTVKLMESAKSVWDAYNKDE